MPPKFNAWILATRPRTLPAAIAPVMLGSAMAIADKNFVGLPALAAFSVALLLQISVNLANDYFDYLKGIDTADRLGPLRVTQSGLIPATQVKAGMMMTFILSMIPGIYLLAVGGLPVLIIGWPIAAALFPWHPTDSVIYLCLFSLDWLPSAVRITFKHCI
jgi:1,4-dihydroxy-2-naphthoate octaprenyltransferase